MWRNSSNEKDMINELDVDYYCLCLAVILIRTYLQYTFTKSYLKQTPLITLPSVYLYDILIGPYIVLLKYGPINAFILSYTRKLKMSIIVKRA